MAFFLPAKHRKYIKKNLFIFTWRTNKPEFANLKSIEESIRMKKNIFGLKFSYKKINIDHTFPKYIIENKEKFKEWII